MRHSLRICRFIWKLLYIYESHCIKIKFKQEDVDSDLKYLDGMGGDLGGLVDRLLPGTSKRFSKMLDTRNNRKLMCYTILFSVVAFFILYHLLSYRGWTFEAFSVT